MRSPAIVLSLAALLAAVLLRARNRVYRRLCEAEEQDSDHDGTPDVYETAEVTRPPAP